MAISGIVKIVSGVVKAIAVDGTERILQVDDRVFPNEQILTGYAGTIAIDFSDGSSMDLGRNSNVTLNDDSLNSYEDIKQANQTQVDALEEVAAIQQALANDKAFDPSKLEAPAAGGASAAGGGEDDGHTVILVNYLNPEETPDRGFETIGINNEPLVLDFSLPELILEPALATISIPIVAPPAVQVTDDNGIVMGDNTVTEDATLDSVTPPPAEGSFVLTTPEGLASITVHGITISEEQLENIGSLPILPITTEEGTLTIVGYTASSGTVNYSYLPSGAKDHSGGDESVVDQIAITVTDDNNITSAPDILDILITDTEPQAFDNFENLPPNQLFLFDNVITNIRNGNDGALDDLQGADGAKLQSVTFAGATQEFISPGDVLQFEADFGTLFIQEDGQYLYNNTTFGEQPEKVDTFQYTLIDGDLDTSSASLTITQVIGDPNTGDVFV